MTAALRREHARFHAAPSGQIAALDCYLPDSQARGTRARALALELSGRVRRARERAGLTREQLAAAADVSTQAVRKWEDPDFALAPNAVHLALSPRDVALPLFRYLLDHHEHEALARPNVDTDTAAVLSEARRACLDLLRALEADNGDHVERAALRVANASRAVLAMRGSR